jgi:predicted nucleic acid-binding protein
MGIVSDTNVIMEVARGNEDVLKRVHSIDNHFYITVVTEFEILIGIPKLKEMDFPIPLKNYLSTDPLRQQLRFTGRLKMAEG